MRSLILALVFAAQAIVDPSGHWEGTIQLPGMEMQIEIDVTTDAKGGFTAVFGQPAASLKGFPFSTVFVEGRSIRLVLKAGEAPSTFEAVVSADGKEMAGDVTQSGQSTRFSLSRTGDAKVVPIPKSVSIGKELEGTWNGTIAADGRQMRIVLKMANHPDGTASGTVMSPDGSGVEIPIAITQKGTTLTIDVPSVGTSFAGELNAARTELAGTWTQRNVALPLTLRRLGSSQ